MNNFLEMALIAVWIVGTFVQPALSFTAGVIVFYIIQIERGVKVLSLWYFIVLIFVSIVGGYYVSQLTPLMLPINYQPVAGAVNFGLGLFSKVILDVILTVDFIKKILGGKK